MPLLHKKPFVRKTAPPGVSPNDKVFYCELTNEPFSDYEEYWERLVLCNAMVWTCELTGRPNLTYQEALDTEAKGLKFLSGLSPGLKLPLLSVGSLTRRGRLNDLSEDVFKHCRDIYFCGEPVEAIVNNHWYDCKVVRVIYPTTEEVEKYEREMAESDEEDDTETGNASATDSVKRTPVKSIKNGCPLGSSPAIGSSTQPITLDDDDDDDDDIQIISSPMKLTPKPSNSLLLTPQNSNNGSASTTPKKSADRKKDAEYPPYATYKYEVQEELAWDYKMCKHHIVTWEQIRRTKQSLTRDKCKLFLKLCTELSSQGYWVLKAHIARKYNIAKVTYKDLFPGNPPVFEESKVKKLPLTVSPSPRGKEALHKLQKKEKKESKLRAKKEERDDKRLSKGGEEKKKKGRPSLSHDEKLSRKIDRLQCQVELTPLGDSNQTQKISKKCPSKGNKNMNSNKLSTAGKSGKTAGKSMSNAGSNKSRANKGMVNGSGNITKHTVVRTREEEEELIRQREKHYAEMRELMRQKIEMQKLEKKQERDVKKEHRRLLALEMKNWLKPREDQLAGGHKPLPSPIPVECGVPNPVFGDFIALLEFINCFTDLLELNDVYPHGITFEMFENGIVAKEVAGVFNDVVQLLLGAVFSLQEEEDEEITADTTVDPALGLSQGQASNDQRLAAVAFANRASQWATQQHNTSLHQLPLDALTLSEVLRIHLLSSGADNNTNAQWRHMNRGGYKHLDDPALQFKLDEPSIMKALESRSIFDLHIDEKVKVLQVLMQQILTYAGVRDRLEETFDKIREVKGNLRDHQAAFRKKENEERQAKALKVKEARQKILDKQAKKKEQQQLLLTGQKQEPKQEEMEEVVDEEEEKEREEREEKNRDKRKQEYSKKEMELLEQIMELSAKACPTPLGSDRAYRRYWVFRSIPGLFIEDDQPFPGTCFDAPTASVQDVCPEDCSDTISRLEAEAKSTVNPVVAAAASANVNSVKPSKEIEEKANTSDKENDGTSPKVNGAFSALSSKSPAALIKVSNNVADTIAKVISSPVGTPNSNNKKLLQSPNIVLNGPVKGVSKSSSKNQSIAKFFTKSPKVEKTNGVLEMPVPLSNSTVTPTVANGDVIIKDDINIQDDVKTESKDEPIVASKESLVQIEVFGLCTANLETCTVHTTEHNRSKWSFYYKEEDLNSIIAGLNERGEREASLKENLLLYRSSIETSVKSCPVIILNPTEGEGCTQELILRKTRRGGKKGGDGDTNLNFPIGTSIDHILELTLRDMILEIEDKLSVGGLGWLQVEDREQWRDKLLMPHGAEGKKDMTMPAGFSWAGKNRIAAFKSDLGLDVSSSSNGEEEPTETDAGSPSIKEMVVALLQVAQCVEGKYLKPPLAENDKLKNKRQKAERKLRRIIEKREKQREEQKQQQESGANADDSDSDSEAGESELVSVSDNSLRLPLERWEASLMASVSYSQVFLHLATLENSVTWSRSLTKTRCRVCRKGGDHEKMLLCDGCDKGHHIYCLKPKLKSIPEGDWFCDKCKPKQKTKSPKKNRTIYIEEEEVNEEEQEEEEEEEEEEDETMEVDGDEEEQDPEDEQYYEDDCCDACHVGGELICCDSCPRTWHKGCAGLKKIPRGTWNCPTCSEETNKKSKYEEKSTKKTSDRLSKREAQVSGKRKRSERRSAAAANSSYEEDLDDEWGPSTNKKRRTDRSSPDSGRAANGRSTSRRGPSSFVYGDDGEVFHPAALSDLLSYITDHEDSWPFQRAVSKKQAPDYYLVIKKPMDLKTMRDKLNSVKYETDAEFIADCLLIFQNCQQYNMNNTDEYKAGVRLGKAFKKRVQELGLPLENEEPEAVEETESKSKRSTAGKRKRQSM